MPTIPCSSAITPNTSVPCFPERKKSVTVRNIFPMTAAGQKRSAQHWSGDSFFRKNRVLADAVLSQGSVCCFKNFCAVRQHGEEAHDKRVCSLGSWVLQDPVSWGISLPCPELRFLPDLFPPCRLRLWRVLPCIANVSCICCWNWHR